MKGEQVMNRLQEIINDPYAPGARWFDLGVQVSIVLSLIAFSLETLPGLSSTQQTWLRVAEVIFISVFSIEYILRVWLSRDRMGYVLGFWGVVDLLAILPFFLGLAVDLRSLRVLRLLRLVRVLKLARYSRAVRRFHIAFRLVREELVLYLGATLLLLYLASVGIYFFEHDAQPDKFSSVFHSLWWSVATLTTVGYGDTYPVTAGGRIFTFVILMLGLGLVSMPAGMIASALSRARDIERVEHKDAQGEPPQDVSARSGPSVQSFVV